MEQKKIQSQQNSSEEQYVELAQNSNAVNEDLISDVDDLLAEIDGVLEENAEEFVRGFIQKGGE